MPEPFSPELTSLAYYGVPAIALVVFLVQALREALRIPGRYLPLVSTVLGTALMTLVTLAPEPVARLVVVGLGLGAAASMTVKFTRSAEKPAPKEPELPSPVRRDDGDDRYPF